MYCATEYSWVSRFCIITYLVQIFDTKIPKLFLHVYYNILLLWCCCYYTYDVTIFVSFVAYQLVTESSEIISTFKCLKLYTNIWYTYKQLELVDSLAIVVSVVKGNIITPLAIGFNQKLKCSILGSTWSV